jgi:glutamate carboxypeptidase
MTAMNRRNALLRWLREHEKAMFQLLERVVNIDSGSRDKAGVDRVGAIFRDFLERADISVQVFALADHGDCLMGTVSGSGQCNAAHVLLLGHMDTVFSRDSAAQRPYRTDGGLAYGPGVADMKAGLVMNAFIARAFKEIGGNAAPLRLLMTGDEEIASPSSRPIIQQMARGAAAVFNAESGRPNGNVVVARKGMLLIDFEVEGVAAHAGINHAQGASAIGALAHKILCLHALTDPGLGITANVGMISGGVSANTVAPHATGQLDVRFPPQADSEHLKSKVVSIVEGESLAGTRGRVTRNDCVLPLTQTELSRQLFERYVRAASEVGFDVHGEFTGGSADSGLTSAVGAATLCATGPVGGLVHTPGEYCRIDTMVPRAQAIALTILDMAESIAENPALR